MYTFRKFTLKDGREIECCILKNDNHSNDYFVVAGCRNRNVGYCNFEIVGDTCKIKRIAVTDGDFLGKGVGSIMFNAMEYFCARNGAKYISGVFTPRGYDNAWELTSKFYKNHHMKSMDYEYDYCDRDDIFKTIDNVDENYNIPVHTDDILFNKVKKYCYITNDIFSSTHRNNKTNSSSTIEL